MKDKDFEVSLPEGYKEAFSIDAKNTRTVILLGIIGSITMLAVFAIFFFCAGIEVMILNVGIRGAVLNILLLEIVSVVDLLLCGAAYRFYTGCKPVFGFTLAVQYCGAPDMYLYRRAAMTVRAIPMVVTSLALLPLTIWSYFSCPYLFGPLSMTFAANLGLNAADMLALYKFHTAFTAPDTLMNDSGIRTTFYTKEK